MATTKTKPTKPYPDFPLTAHPNGQWCKKIRGKVHFFGVWADTNAALAEYLEIRDDLQAGRIPRSTAGQLTVCELVNQYLTTTSRRMHAGEISSRTFTDYRAACEHLIERLGRSTAVDTLHPTDFAEIRHDLAERYSIGRLNKTITVMRMVFRWAYESDLIDRPVKFGPDFRGASRKTMRMAKARQLTKLYEPDELRLLIDAATQPLNAMILLAINGGLGNTDVAELTTEVVDGTDGWLNYPRPKTGVNRRIPLWAKTTEALGEVIATRPAPIKPEYENRVFLTRNGLPFVWHRVGRANDEISKRFRRLLKSTSMYRQGRTFYALRHTFQTIGDEARDPVATSAIMGHADASMASLYREQISDERLVAVVTHVHEWLFGS